MIVFHNALVLPCAAEPGGPDWFHGWVAVDDAGLVSGLGEGTPPPHPGAELVDLEGCFLAPGFVSAHSHLFTAGLRGIAQTDTLYTWVSTMGDMLVGAEPEDLYWMTLAGATDFLRHGVTSAYDFTQSRVVSRFDFESSTLRAERAHDVDFLTRQIDAHVDAGLRAVTAVRLDDEQLPEEEGFAAFDAVVAHLGSHVPSELDLGASVYGAVQWSSTPATAERERAVMDRHGVGNQAHFVETAEQIDVQRSRFTWYDQAGVLGPDFAFGHFVHPTDHMVDRVAETDTAVVWQATSNGRLGSGVADVVRYREAGIRVGLGIDDQSCTDTSDPFQNMRIGLYSQRALHTSAAAMSAADVLRLHTIGAAAAVGVADRVGSIEVGKHADLLVVDPRDPDVGPLWDPVASYVLACGPENLRAVYSGGREVVSGGRLLHTDAAEVRAQLHERAVRAAAARGYRPAFVPDRR